MTKEQLPPLSSDEIRAYLTQLSNGLLALSLMVKEFENLLLQKELATEIDIKTATDRATAQAKDLAAMNFLASIRPKPDEGVQ